MKKCLIIIDVQKGFINKDTKHIPKIVEKLQYKYKYVVITQFFNPKKSLYQKLLNWNKLSKKSNDYKLAFKPKSDTFKISKSTYSDLTKKLKIYIKLNNLKTFDICGIDTDICVTKTAVDLFELNYIPIILNKACGSSGGKKYHKKGLSILKRYIGKNNCKSKI